MVGTPLARTEGMDSVRPVARRTAAVVLYAAAVACTSRSPTPNPGPPQEPTASRTPTVPSCVIDTDCGARGLTCVAGFCVVATDDVDAGTFGCPTGCPLDQ